MDVEMICRDQTGCKHDVNMEDCGDELSPGDSLWWMLEELQGVDVFEAWLNLPWIKHSQQTESPVSQVYDGGRCRTELRLRTCCQ